MPIQIFEHVKGNELFDSLKDKIQTDPDRTYRIVIESEQDYISEVPIDEESITEETVVAVRQSEDDHRMKRYIECRNEGEVNHFFEQLKNDSL